MCWGELNSQRELEGVHCFVAVVGVVVCHSEESGSSLCFVGFCLGKKGGVVQSCARVVVGQTINQENYPEVKKKKKTGNA